MQGIEGQVGVCQGGKCLGKGVTSLEGGSKGARQAWKECGAAVQNVEEKGYCGRIEMT